MKKSFSIKQKIKSVFWLESISPLDKFLDSRDNNLNLIRFLAAAMVIFGHSYDMMGRLHEEPLFKLTGRSISETAVNIFFVLSGLLIAGSWQRRNSAGHFLWLRFIRIYPALWCSILFCIILGAILTNLRLWDYFTDLKTLKFFILNSTMFWKHSHGLPGIFPDLRYAGSINGSLWTLPWELKMYVAVFLIGTFGLFFHRRYVVAATAIFWIALTLINLCGIHVNPVLLAAIRLTSFFFFGVCAFLFRDKLVLHPMWFFLIFLSVLVVCFYSKNYGGILFDIYLPYATLFVAFMPNGLIRHYNSLGDYSYGTYIYAFPIQQLTISYFTHFQPVEVFYLSLIVTLVLAVLSWRFIELPALRARDLFKKTIK